MSSKKSKLNQIIDTLCEGKDENYKAFIKKDYSKICTYQEGLKNLKMLN